MEQLMFCEKKIGKEVRKFLLYSLRYNIIHNISKRILLSKKQCGEIYGIVGQTVSKNYSFIPSAEVDEK
jgi:hypothetical protein